MLLLLILRNLKVCGGRASNGITFIPSFMKMVHNMHMHRWHGDLISPLSFLKKGDKAKNKLGTRINISITCSLGKWNTNEAGLHYACTTAICSSCFLMKQEICFITRIFIV
jgi:hypothetical protein